MPSLLLGQSGEWPAALVSDAAFAYRKHVGPLHSVAPAPVVWRVCVASGQVTAACASSYSGCVCLGYASGLVMTFDPCTGSTQPLACTPKEPWSVASAAFDAEGKHLLILHIEEGKSGMLTGYTLSDCEFRNCALFWRAIPLCGPGYLTPMVAASDVHMAGLWNGQDLEFLSGPDVVPMGRVQAPFSLDTFRGALILDPAGPSLPLCVLFDEDAAWQMGPSPTGDAPEAVPARFRFGWRPGIADGSALCHPPLAFCRPDASKLELVEVDEAGTLRWSLLLVSPFQLAPGALAYAAAERYRAATFVGLDRIAAVRSGGVDWLRRGESRLVLTSTTPAGLSDAVACFFSPLTRELLIVASAGDIVRVAAPNA